MKAILLPIDNRPVTYIFPQLILSMAGVEVITPPRDLMGSLAEPATPLALSSWMENKLKGGQADALICCLDSLLYGGLISSRRSSDNLKQLTERADLLRSWKKALGSGRPILATSSIMRVSDNYDATEEKPYWATHGREIFSWSSALHKLQLGMENAQSLVEEAEARIPVATRQDYLATRRRNFQVNSHLINLVRENVIDYLIFSLDDSGQHGLNILEKERLMNNVATMQLQNKVSCYPGADEVICTLIARWLTIAARKSPLVETVFSGSAGGNEMSLYEGQSIKDSVNAQIVAAGMQKVTTADQEPELRVIVHSGGERQGDHILLPGHPDLRQLNTQEAANNCIKLIEESTIPCILCDVAYANGADPILTEMLLERPDLFSKIWGYAGWNTTGNAVGTALGMAMAKWFSMRWLGLAETVDKLYKQCLFIRLTDDWAYQARVRSMLKGPASPDVLQSLMKPYLERICQALNFYPEQFHLMHPWQRTFEIEVNMPVPEVATQK